MTLLFLIFVAGVLHGLGPDHLAAVTALAAVGGGARRLVFYALRFALGHALVLAAAGLAAYSGRTLLPPEWEQRLDVTFAALLLASGVALLAGLALGKLDLHAHEHAHGGERHQHLHLHFFARPAHRHGHGKFAVLLGAVFALGGARALLAVVPMAVAETLAASLLRLAVFGAGIVLAMVAYGFAAGRMLRWAERRPLLGPRVATAATALFCVAAGALMLYAHWQA